jgi:hypothetical protein
MLIGADSMTTKTWDSVPPIENYDPLARFLTQILHLSPFAFGLLVFVADIAVDGWLGWHHDVFLSTSGMPGLLQDYMALITDFVFNPIICGTYLWTTEGTSRLFDQLQKSGIFKSQARFEEAMNKARPLYRKRAVFYFALSFALIFSITQIGGYLGWFGWKAVGGYIDLQPTMSYVRAPFWFLTVYSLTYAAFNVGVTIFVLRRMFSKVDIELLPLHPDGCGGLGSISQYSATVGFAIGAIGLMISAATVLEVRQGTLFLSYPVLAGIVAYPICAPLFFFLPLGTAHKAMQDAKDKELLELARQFDVVYSQLKQASVDKPGPPESSSDMLEHTKLLYAIIDEFPVKLRDTRSLRRFLELLELTQRLDAVCSQLRQASSHQTADYEAGTKKLEHLRQLYAIAEDFPVWPFDTRNLRRFLTIVTTPLIPALISVASELVKTFILP